MTDEFWVSNTRKTRRIVRVVVVLAILAVAIIGRRHVVDVGMGSETLGRHDEHHYAPAALRFRDGDHRPRNLVNPTGYAYLVAGVLAITPGDDDLDRARLVGRTTTAICGVLGVLVLFVLGRAMFGFETGAVAALALAVGWTPMSRAVIAGNEVPMTLGVLLTMLAIWRYVEKPTRRRHVVTGIVFGLACALKYNAGLMLIPFVAATLWNRPWRWGGFVAAPVSFLATTPSLVTHFQKFFDDFRRQATYLDEGWSPRDTSAFADYVDHLPRENGLLWLIVVAIGIVAGTVVAIRRRRIATPHALLALAVIPGAGYLASGQFGRMRFLLPILPFAHLLAAAFLVVMTRRLPSSVRPWVTLAAVVVLLGPAAWSNQSAQLDKYGRKDARTEIVDWVREHLSSAEKYVELSTGSARVMPRDYDATSLLAVARGSDDYADFRRRLVAVGARDLVLIGTPNDLRRLPELAERRQRFAVVPFWSRIATDLARLPRTAAHLTKDKKMAVVVYRLR